jgi:tripartite-type tricarboxylate transporter receptor subunit TctC
MLRMSVLGMIAALAASPATAQTFAGKTFTIITSTGPGGTYDLTARLTARHMPRYLEGAPAMVVQNMPGGGHVLATNFMYNVAPKDGTTIATVNNVIPLHQVISGEGVRYDASKFNWLGSTGAKNSAVYAWHAAGVKTIDDVMQKEITLGATGAGSSTVMYTRAMNNLIGTKFKLVTGYKQVSEIEIALQRGEVDASTGSLSSILVGHPEWITEKKLVFLAQMGATRDKILPDVPLLTELATSDEDRQIMKLLSSPLVLGCPFFLPPDVDQGRVTILRKAFEAVLNDPAFQAESEKASFPIEPMGGVELAAIIADLVSTPSAVVAKGKEATVK